MPQPNAGFSSGVGGYALFIPTGGSQLTVANENWNEDIKNRLAEVTNAGSGGNSQWIATVTDQTGTFDVVWDANNRPETGGLFSGNTGAISLLFGTTGHADTQYVIIEGISKKLNTQNGAIMYACSYKGQSAVVST